tara:strand:+ start:4210 stop:4536 length:327 start_codon:yes stop_codon:yes gene_type:complete
MSATEVRQLTEFLRLGFAEKIVFHSGTGLRRTIQALVDRSPSVDVMSNVAPGMSITVMNDQLLGIDPSELDVGIATVEIPKRRGEVPAARGIQQIEKQDDKWITLSII